jgi:hypothetical protein
MLHCTWGLQRTSWSHLTHEIQGLGLVEVSDCLISDGKPKVSSQFRTPQCLVYIIDLQYLFLKLCKVHNSKILPKYI